MADCDEVTGFLVYFFLFFNKFFFSETGFPAIVLTFLINPSVRHLLQYCEL